MTSAEMASANILDFRHIGWKYYNQIRKKVMDKSSASGLFVSLSIAFFIVIFAASFLRICYISIERSDVEQKIIQEKIYQLEVFNNNQDSQIQYLQPGSMNRNKIDSISSMKLA